MNPVPPQSDRQSWGTFARTALLLLVTLAVAAATRLYGLGELNYWFDESFSIRMSQFPVTEMFARCGEDTHPPLFFLLLKGWTMALGQVEWPTRLLSTLWSLGAVACAFGFTYEALWRADERPSTESAALFAATIAGLAVALSPLQISWAQQVRMYAQVTCLTLMSTWLLWRAVERPGSGWRWLAFVLVEIAGLYTHVTMLFVIAGHFLALGAVIVLRCKAGVSTRLLALRSAFAMSAVGLTGLPWILVIRAQHARVQDDFWIRPFNLDLLGEAFVKCFGVYQRPVPDPSLGLWLGQGMLIILALVAAGRRSFDLLVALTAAMPFVLLIAVSLMSENIVNARYFIAGHSLACVAVAVLISRVPWWQLKVPVAASVLGILAYCTVDYHAWRETAAQGAGIPGLLSTWRDHRVANEPLVFSNPMFYTTGQIYSEVSDKMKIFGDEGDYPFFVGTAVTSHDEYLSADEIDAQAWNSIWVCDYGQRERFLNPVQLSNSWQLVSETSTKDYSGTFYLRRYDRR